MHCCVFIPQQGIQISRIASFPVYYIVFVHLDGGDLKFKFTDTAPKCNPKPQQNNGMALESKVKIIGRLRPVYVSKTEFVADMILVINGFRAERKKGKSCEKA